MSMSGIARATSGPQGPRKALLGLIRASTRLPGDDEPSFFGYGAKQGESDGHELWGDMGIGAPEDRFNLSSDEVGDLVGPIGRRRERAELLEQLADTGNAGILRQINIKAWDLPNGDREIRFTRPPLPYEKIFEAINALTDCKEVGILAVSDVITGFEDDIVPTKPVKHIVVIHFGSGDRTRGEQELFLSERDERFVHPGDLAIAEGARLAKAGIEQSLFRRDGFGYSVRTEKLKAKNGQPVWDLFSGGSGLYSRHYIDRIRDSYVVAAASPKHRA